MGSASEKYKYRNLIVLVVFLLISFGLMIFSKTLKEENVIYRGTEKYNGKEAIRCVDEETEKKDYIIIAEDKDYEKDQPLIVYYHGKPDKSKKGEIVIKPVHVSLN